MPLLRWAPRVVVRRCRAPRRQADWQAYAGTATPVPMPMWWCATGEKWRLQCDWRERRKRGPTRVDNEPAHQPNNSDSPNPALTSPFQAGRYGRGVMVPERQSQPPQFPHRDRPRLLRHRIPQRIGGIIVATRGNPACRPLPPAATRPHWLICLRHGRSHSASPLYQEKAGPPVRPSETRRRENAAPNNTASLPLCPAPRQSPVLGTRRLYPATAARRAANMFNSQAGFL